VPDDPGPRLRLPRRALWVAPVTVLGLVAAVVVGIRVLGVSGGSQSAASQSPYVVTAPASSVATHPAEFEQSPRIGPALEPLARPCSTGSPQTLRVLQFNIHAGISQSGSVDLGRVATEIRRVRPDLVSLNEVDSGTLRSGGLDEAAYLARATGLHAVYGPNLFYDGGLFGNAILSRYPVVRTHNLALPTVLGLEPRGLLTATVRVGGRTVSFSSVHLSDGGDGGASRTAQASTVARLVGHTSPPTIVAGDLNSQPGDPPARILRQYLLDSQQQAGAGSGDTVPQQDPVSRFDYVFYDNRLAAVPGSTRVLPSAVSDHRSVFTELALRSVGGC
jgi:endonuclease/exonuclease/phosphatase family metal-dependent hydrolase